jgi:hypothetical protein
MKINKKDEHDLKKEEDEKGGDQEGGSEGTGTGIEFHFDVLTPEPRDDALPPNEIKRLLAQHQDIHKARVDKQKLTRKERQALKEGRAALISAANFRAGFNAGGGGPPKSEFISK